MQSIRKRSFSGPRGSKFAKIEFPRDDMTLMVRERDLDETLRKPMTKKKARAVLEHIADWNAPVSEQWKARANAHQEKLDDADPFALAEVYKALSLRQQADKLSAADRRQLAQSQEQLTEEIAMALGQTENKALKNMQKSARA